MTTRDELSQMRRLAKASEELERGNVLREYGMTTSPENEVAQADFRAELERSDEETAYAINGFVLNLRKLFGEHSMWRWVGDGYGSTDKQASSIVIESSLGLVVDRDDVKPYVYVTASASSMPSMSAANLFGGSLSTGRRVYSGLVPVPVLISVSAGTEAEARSLSGVIETTIRSLPDDWRRGRWHAIGDINKSLVQTPAESMSPGQPAAAPQRATKRAIVQISVIVYHQWMSVVSARQGTQLMAQAHVLG